MIMVVGREDLQLNVGSESQRGGAGILYVSKVLSSVEVMVSVCGQKSLHTDLTENRTWNPLDESPVLYPETTRFP
jgi:hypothetical protein